MIACADILFSLLDEKFFFLVSILQNLELNLFGEKCLLRAQVRGFRSLLVGDIVSRTMMVVKGGIEADDSWFRSD